MRQLIYFEWRKSFHRLAVLALLVLFTAVDVAKIYSVYQENSHLAMDESWHTAFWGLYDNYAGEMNTDKINSLLVLYRPLEEQTADLTATTAYGIEGTLTGNIWSDKNLIDRYYMKPMQYCYTYQNLAAQIHLKANENVSLYTVLNNSYEVSKNRRIAALYNGRQVHDFRYTEGWQYYVYYDFSVVLSLLLCLYGLSQMFPRERESRMDMLLPTARNGGRRTVAGKLIAGTLYIVGISLWFSVVDYFSFSSIFNLWDGAALPIYAINNLAYASVPMTMWQYAIATALSRALGIWVVGMAILIISIFCRHAMFPIATGVMATMLLSLTGAKWSYSSHTWLAALNPYSLMAGRLLYGRTEFVNFFGIPILSWEAAVPCALTVGLCSVLMVFHFSCRGNQKRGRHS